MILAFLRRFAVLAVLSASARRAELLHAILLQCLSWLYLAGFLANPSLSFLWEQVYV